MTLLQTQLTSSHGVPMHWTPDDSSPGPESVGAARVGGAAKANSPSTSRTARARRNEFTGLRMRKIK